MAKRRNEVLQRSSAAKRRSEVPAPSRGACGRRLPALSGSGEADSLTPARRRAHTALSRGADGREDAHADPAGGPWPDPSGGGQGGDEPRHAAAAGPALRGSGPSPTRSPWGSTSARSARRSRRGARPTTGSSPARSPWDSASRRRRRAPPSADAPVRAGPPSRPFAGLESSERPAAVGARRINRSRLHAPRRRPRSQRPRSARRSRCRRLRLRRVEGAEPGDALVDLERE